MLLKHRYHNAEEDPQAIYQRHQWHGWLAHELVSLPSTLKCIKTAKEGISNSELLLQLQDTTLLTKSIHHEIVDIKTLKNVYETIHGDLEVAFVRNMTTFFTLASTQNTLKARMSSLEVKVGKMDGNLDCIFALLQPDAKKGGRRRPLMTNAQVRNL